MILGAAIIFRVLSTCLQTTQEKTSIKLAPVHAPVESGDVELAARIEKVRQRDSMC
jgi:hypothetical protein